MSTICTNHTNVVARTGGVGSRVGEAVREASDYITQSRAYQDGLDGTVCAAEQVLNSISQEALGTTAAIAENMRRFQHHTSERGRELDQAQANYIAGGGV